MLIYVLLTIVTGIVFGQDPCSDKVYSMLPDLSKRSPSFLEDSVPLCDKYLYKKWYRAGDFYQIPTTAPELISCGTLYPYWMDGSLPVGGSLSTVKMCRVGFDSNCEKSHNIRMKNCGLYSDTIRCLQCCLLFRTEHIMCR
ncbi:oncoprotein-induced transcript 3 protein-like [Saccostrea echinata]|uniref:oncoprotein-induced transcript 3 protein-like n=1 Tax=Saccostrea echinata TaxID=191078 RepID=UPI002A835CE0|nr:oncoprotein-induced transcript 3 protein-like [Saccostrea echinata]